MNVYDYFIPHPPKNLTESGAALRKRRLWHPDLEDKRSVWERHADELVRCENRVWLRSRALSFAQRWACVSFVGWGLGWVAEDVLWLEAPLVLTGFVSGAIAVMFVYVHRLLHRSPENVR